ncbi:hypothetical protein BaRGS_00011441, partial [Batillaria attramentaria]
VPDPAKQENTGRCMHFEISNSLTRTFKQIQPISAHYRQESWGLKRVNFLSWYSVGQCKNRSELKDNGQNWRIMSISTENDGLCVACVVSDNPQCPSRAIVLYTSLILNASFRFFGEDRKSAAGSAWWC